MGERRPEELARRRVASYEVRAFAARPLGGMTRARDDVALVL